MSCLNSHVKKLPYTLDAMHYNYDITKPQPQLFVTPNFAHLTAVLEEFKKLMAWTTGGMDGVRKAIASEQTGTVEFSSGLQVTGTFTNVLEEDGLPIFIQTTGPTALSLNNIQLKDCGKERFASGFSSPVGKLITSPIALEDMSGEVLRRNGIELGEPATLNFEHGIVIKGLVQEIIRGRSGKIVLIEFNIVTVRYKGKLLMAGPSYSLAVGEKIVSAFAGPADVEAFQPTVIVPHEKMHKIYYDDKTLQLHELYLFVRHARGDEHMVSKLPYIWKSVVHDFPDDWLLSLEILEILQHHASYQQVCEDIRSYLEKKRGHQPQLEKLITNGLKLL
jgi:phenylalanine-4-hydroxylase